MKEQTYEARKRSIIMIMINIMIILFAKVDEFVSRVF